MDHNELASIPDEIENLMYLRELDVSHNLLTSLNPCLGRLGALIRLNISYNRIHGLPSGLAHLLQLEDLILDGNDIVNPPREVLVRGTRVETSFSLACF